MAPPPRSLTPPSLGSILGCGLSLLACAEAPENDDLDEAAAGLRGLEDGLELHWSFEDRVGSQITDLSGKGRHGTLVGGWFVASPLGEALSLDGVDDYVALTPLGLRDPALYGGVDGELTISARVRVDDPERFNTLCWGCGPLSAMYVGTPLYGPKLLTTLFNQDTRGAIWPLSSTELGGGEWREITLIVDGGGGARYYLDCALDGELDDAGVGLKDYGFSAVGQGSSADRWYQGEIDQLRIWSRALTDVELAELCPTPDPLADGLTLHWTFEDRVGDQITDLSGGGGHGTLIGGSFVSSTEGEAVSLDGVDDWIGLTGPRSPALYGGVDGDFTISARVRVQDVDKHNTLCFGCGPSSTWYLGGAGGRMTAGFFDQVSQGQLWTASSPGLIEDTWTEVTMVVDGGVGVRHYFDCGLDSEVLDPDVGLKDYGFSSLGRSGNAARWFGGEIDELRIWDRALTDAELQQLCDPCLGPFHVDADAPEGGDGKSWASAFNQIDDALAASLACPSPEIWVAEGSYGTDPQVAVMTITAPVSLYAGFAGTELTRAERDVAAHPVVLGGPGWTRRTVEILDSAIEPGAAVVLDGFTVTGNSQGGISIKDLTIDTEETLVYLHNLVISEHHHHSNGAGLHVLGAFGVEITGCRFENNTINTLALTRGAAIYFERTHLNIDDSEFINNLSRYAVINERRGPSPDEKGRIEISNSLLSGNSGGGIWAHDIHVSDCVFVDNVAWKSGNGGAIGLRGGTLEVESSSFSANVSEADGGAIWIAEEIEPVSVHVADSSFSDNQGRRGGAIGLTGFGSDFPFTLLIEDSEFVANTATYSSGGAIGLRNGAGTIELERVVFEGNDTAGNGGALYVGSPELTVDLTELSFVDNGANKAGAVAIDEVESMVIRDSRFVGNHADASIAGALWIFDGVTDVSVINTAFIANTATTHGGAVYGRGALINTSFANNLAAGGEGDALFANAGAPITLRNVVAWPDNLWASSMILDHACVPEPSQVHTNSSSVYLDADPFAAQDLDLDGQLELYLAPGSACVDIGAATPELDWASMTTQSSQCTDVTPIDAGVHYPPLSAAGPCP